MAGEWLKIEHATPDKSEVWEIATDLGLNPDAVMGKLIRVWAWASENCHEDGVTSVTAISIIDRIAGQKGFANSMKKVKWLKIKKTKKQEKLIFVNFDFHMSKSAKARAEAQKRKRRQREKDQNPVTDLSQSKRDINVTREEKRREEEKKKKEQELPFSSPEFLEAWNGYLEVRKLNKQKNTGRALTLLLNGMKGRTEAEVIEALNKAIVGSWRGLHYKEKTDPNHRPGVIQL